MLTGMWISEDNNTSYKLETIRADFMKEGTLMIRSLQVSGIYLTHALHVMSSFKKNCTG